MMLDYFSPLLLARIQFAFTVGFHIIFPAFTIGLATFLTFLEFSWLRSNDEKYRDLYKFWVKIFAVAFGMGVVSGVVMSYQFGTNWSRFSDKVANVLGPLLGFEVLTAFFLEASFLGIMLFGWGRVTRRMHFVSTCVVAIGTTISAFWILAANSWMQTPQAYYIGENGILYPENWLKIIFNPSFPYRFAHMLTAAYLTTTLVIGGVGAFYLLRDRYIPHARIMLTVASALLLVLAPSQVLIGDMHGLNTLHHQPVKVAAMEGLWESEKGAGLRLFAWPDEQAERNEYEVVIPKVSSLILTHSWDGEVRGLKAWPRHERPPVKPVFFAFRVMVGLGFLMVFLAITSLFLYMRKKLYDNKVIRYFWLFMSPMGFIAIIAGWMVTEVGRQPYSVYGVLRVADSVSPSIVSNQVLISLLLFVLVYSLVFGAGIYYIFKLIRKGITDAQEDEKFYKHSLESTLIDSLTKSNLLNRKNNS